MTRFFLRRAPDPRPSLVVQTCARAGDPVIREFTELLHRIGCSDGLLFDPDQCYVVHDSFSTLGPESLKVDAVIPTDAVLAKLDRPGVPNPSKLDGRVELWLELLSSQWEDAISDDPEIAAAFLTDVVPAAVRGVVSAEHDAEDAA